MDSIDTLTEELTVEVWEGEGVDVDSEALWAARMADEEEVSA